MKNGAGNDKKGGRDEAKELSLLAALSFIFSRAGFRAAPQLTERLEEASQYTI